MYNWPLEWGSWRRRIENLEKPIVVQQMRCHLQGLPLFLENIRELVCEIDHVRVW